MNKFAKLFDLEAGIQVLLTVSYNNDDDKFELAVRTDHVSGNQAQVVFGFADEDKAVAALESYTQDRAIEFRAQMERMMSGE